MANALLTNPLLNPLLPFMVVSGTTDTFTMGQKEIHNTDSIYRGMLVLYNAQGSDRTSQDSYTQNASSPRIDGGPDGDNTCIIRKFSVQHIVKHIGTGKNGKHIVR